MRLVLVGQDSSGWYISLYKYSIKKLEEHEITFLQFFLLFAYILDYCTSVLHKPWGHGSLLEEKLMEKKLNARGTKKEAVELTEKLPLEPDVGLHAAPSASNLHIAPPAWWNWRTLHPLPAVLSSSIHRAFKLFPAIFPRFFHSGQPKPQRVAKVCRRSTRKVPCVRTLSNIFFLGQLKEDGENLG